MTIDKGKYICDGDNKYSRWNQKIQYTDRIRKNKMGMYWMSSWQVKLLRNTVKIVMTMGSKKED